MKSRRPKSRPTFVASRSLRPRFVNALSSTLCLAGALGGCGDAGWEAEPGAGDTGDHATESSAILGVPEIPLYLRTTLERAVVKLNNKSSDVCTGTLVRPNWVISAKHCYDYTLGLGMDVKHDSGVTVSVPPSNIYAHPDPVVDALLLKLNTPINALQVSSIDFFDGKDSDVVGKNLTLYGYGAGNYLLPNLTKASVLAESIHNYGSMGAEVYNRKYLRVGGTVGGDSGGPAFLGSKLVTITGGGVAKLYSHAFRGWAMSLIDPDTSPHLGAKTTFIHNLAPGVTIPRTGDINGDGYVDVVQFNQDSDPAGSVYVLLGSASGVSSSMSRWHTQFSRNGSVPEVGDVNGDGLDDIIMANQANGQVHVALSNGTSFGVATLYHGGFSFAGSTFRVADMNGDARVDIINFNPNGAQNALVAISCGPQSIPPASGCTGLNMFGSASIWKSGFATPGAIPFAGDVDGDGMADLVKFVHSTRRTEVAKTVRQSCTSHPQCEAALGPGNLCFVDAGYCYQSPGKLARTTSTWAYDSSSPGHTPMLADMNGDGKLDVANFETTTAYGRNGHFGVQLSDGSRFGTYTTWGTGMCTAGMKCFVGGVGRDTRDDIFAAGTPGAAFFARSLGR